MDKIVINLDEARKESFKELFSKLSSNEKGLSNSEAKKRIQEYGMNEISEKKSILLLNSLNTSGGPWHGL